MSFGGGMWRGNVRQALLAITRWWNWGSVSDYVSRPSR